MGGQIRLIFTVTTNDGTKTTSNALLDQITEDTISIKTRKPIRFDSKELKVASVSVRYGNNANILFFLNELNSCKRIPESKDYIYTFNAPKVKNVDLQKYNLNNISATCSGYEKFRMMLQPKRVKAEY